MDASNTTLAGTQFSSTLDKLVEGLELKEVAGPDGGPLLRLSSTMDGSEVGNMRVFEGEGIQRVVTVSLSVPAFQMDSHMLFAFTSPDSPVPHFTLDSVFAGGYFAFHLDLVPRVDLAANLAYMDAVFAPLTESFESARSIDGLSRAELSPRQIALMSPWMLAHRADETAFAAIAPLVEQYADHWMGLLESDVAAEAAARGVGGDAATMAARDTRWREAIFNPDVDPVWARVDKLIGSDAAVRVRRTLGGQS